VFKVLHCHIIHLLDTLFFSSQCRCYTLLIVRLCCICLTEHVSKKFKSLHETEQRNSETSTDVSCVSVSCLPLARLANARHSNVSRRIPNSDFMAVTSFDGQRVYVTMKTEGFVQRQVI